MKSHPFQTDVSERVICREGQKRPGFPRIQLGFRPGFDTLLYLQKPLFLYLLARAAISRDLGAWPILLAKPGWNPPESQGRPNTIK